MSLSPNAFVPIDALRLAEDIQTLELVIDLLGKVDPSIFHDEKNEAMNTLRRVSHIVMAVRNKARDQLRYTYLVGSKPLKPRHKLQTLADVWEILRDDLNNRRKIERQNKSNVQPA